MPEGDTIWRLSERLQPLVGRVITHSDFRIAPLATASLTGECIDRIWPYGKHLFTDFDDRRTLHTHLRMDGTWRAYAPRERWTARPAHLIRVVLRAPTATAVGLAFPGEP